MGAHTTARERQEIIARYRRSGLTQREFCDREGVNFGTLQSIVATCQLHDVNPEAYVTDVLVRLTPGCDVEPLMPWTWAPTAEA